MRSFLLGESIYRPTTLATSAHKSEADIAEFSLPIEDLDAHKDSELGILLHGFNKLLAVPTLFTVDSLVTVGHNLKEKLLPRKKPKIWTSQKYFDAQHFTTTEESFSQITSQLDPDLESLFDEHCFNRLSVCYEYGKGGIRNGYSQSMSEIARNFLELLKAQGRPTERAELELEVALYAEAWIDSSVVKTGEKLIFISPRGSEPEFYPGLKQENQVFVNILEKIDTGVLFHQLRNYDTHADLPTLQARIKQKSGGFSQTITTAHRDYHTHHIIANFLHLPASFSLSEISTEVHFNKRKWPVNIDTQLPHLSKAVIDEKNLEARLFCLSKFKELTKKQLLPAEKVAAFDALIELVRAELNKWIENNATNYDKTKQISYALNLEKSVTAVWEAANKKTQGKKLSALEKQALKAFEQMTALNPALPLNRITSLAHCIVGSPTSLLQAPGMEAIAGNLVPGVSLENSWIMNLTVQELSLKITELESFVPITLGGETWYVPPDYLTGKGCYIDPETGIAMGPCNHPLGGIYKNQAGGWERDNALTKKEYFSLLQELRMVEDLLATTQDISSEQQVIIQKLYFNMLKYLIVPTASPERILHNDFLRPRAEVQDEFIKVYENIQSSLTPLIALFQYLVQLARTNKEEITQLETTIQVNLGTSGVIYSAN